MRRIPLLPVVLLLLQAAATAPAGATGFELLPEATVEESAQQEPTSAALALLMGPAAVPLDFRLASGGTAAEEARPAPGVAWSATSGMGRLEALPSMRLWLQLPDGGAARFTRAYLSLSTSAPTGQVQRQWRPGAGVVMNLRSSPGWLQQMSLGSVLRFDMAEGAQVALRLKGGRVGVQYRAQFNL